MKITEEYRALQTQLHEERDDYGVASIGHAPMIAQIIIGLGIESLLDYGAGKGRLGPALAQHLPPTLAGVRGQSYDPAVPKFNKEPDPADLVVCIDVMEHVEEGCVVPVLDHIKGLARKAAVFTISTVLAGKTLADGRNAHITLWQPEVWLSQFLLPRFSLIEATFDGKELIFIGEPKHGNDH